MNRRLAVGEHCLGQLVLGREQRLLRLQHGEQVAGPLAVLKLRYLESFLRRRDQPAQMAFRAAGVGCLRQRKFHIGIGIERGTLIGGHEFLLCGLCQVFLSGQLAAVEDGLQQAGAIAVSEAGTLKQCADGGADEPA